MEMCYDGALVMPSSCAVRNVRKVWTSFSCCDRLLFLVYREKE